MLVCLFVSNKRQNGGTDPKFCVGPHMTPENFKISKLASNKLGFSSNFENPRTLSCFTMYFIQRENVLN